jgi:hypothetical protein
VAGVRGRAASDDTERTAEAAQVPVDVRPDGVLHRLADLPELIAGS